MSYRKREVRYPGELQYDDSGWVVSRDEDGDKDDLAFVQTETMADRMIASLSGGTAPKTEMPEVKVGGKNRLTCPRCGASGLDNFIYVEDVSNYRSLKTLNRGLLTIESHYDVFDENGDNPHLGCKKCDADLAIPVKLDLDWE